MKDQEKKKEELISEVAELRQRIAELEALEAERKRAEEALRESEEKYRRLVERPNDGITIIQDGIVRMERFASETFPRSITIETEIGKDLWSLKGDPTQLHQVLLNLSSMPEMPCPEGEA